MYTGKAKELLEGYGIGPGDLVRVEMTFPRQTHRKNGQQMVLDCVLLDRGSRSREENIILKLDSGYNLSIHYDHISNMTLLQRTPPSGKVERRTASTGNTGKKVTLIGTGGTIASMVDYRTGAVHPAMTPTEMNEAIPDISGICDLEHAIASSILSEDVSCTHWDMFTMEVEKAFASGAVGVVIAHGTDTLASTSAALSFTLRNPPGPVVLVGSQRSSDRPSSDARMNLEHACILASSGLPGAVYVVMHATISDSASLIHLGTKVRKMHSTRRDAFMSINRMPVGVIDDDGIRLIEPPPPGTGEFSTSIGFNERVMLISAQVSDLSPLLDCVRDRYSALVIAGSGMGHLSSRYLEKVRGIVKEGIPVVMATDCINGSTDLDVYSTGRDLIDAGVIPAGDMPPHVAHIKSMWVMERIKGVSIDDRVSSFAELFLTDLAGEMGQRRTMGTFGIEYLEMLKGIGVD
ncbi:MAG: Glu-tRNA(Gln) amidotransferase subunit GatD [Candidatus Thermoplasmatota archaeon]|nr:Glu-tRNA(Gln) amidotransferase subunit GatD [Candidatus Thermoplasmatota archaeon]